MILDNSSSSARAREDLACVHADKDKVPYRGICPDARRLGKILSYIEYVRPYAILTALQILSYHETGGWIEA